MCLEKRAFYRIISGLHASINIHLSAKYLLSGLFWGKMSLMSSPSTYVLLYILQEGKSSNLGQISLNLFIALIQPLLKDKVCNALGM